MDIDAGNPKSRFLRRFAALKADRDGVMSEWRDISDYLLPRRGRFLVTDRNKSNSRRNNKIINNAATVALRTTTAGLMTGITSSSRPWFRLATPDPGMMERQSVKLWLADAERMMREVFNRSNLYNALSTLYEELVAFGTGPMIVYEDDETVIHCETLTAGEYAIGVDRRGRVDTLYRERSMTVAQVVEEFGLENVSDQVKNHWNRREYDKWIDVLHVIEPNRDRDPRLADAKNMPYRSVWLEMGGDSDKLLRVSGFEEQPFMCPRWHVVAADYYGTGPALECLGDIKALQTMEREHAKAVAKANNPPLNAPASLKGDVIGAIPGSVNYVDQSTPNAGVRPMLEVNPRTAETAVEIERTERRIKDGMYATLFMMIANDERGQPPTAEEIIERRSEKMQQVGPVLEQLHHELLDPLIDRVFAIMVRRSQASWRGDEVAPQLLPPPPEEMNGVNLRVDYISVLAQAQKSNALGSIERFAAFIANQAQANPDILDKIDLDQAADEYADALGVSARIVRSDDAVTKLRAGRQQQRQQMEQVAMAQQVAIAAKDGSAAMQSAANAAALGADPMMQGAA